MGGAKCAFYNTGRDRGVVRGAFPVTGIAILCLLEPCIFIPTMLKALHRLIRLHLHVPSYDPNHVQLGMLLSEQQRAESIATTSTSLTFDNYTPRLLIIACELIDFLSRELTHDDSNKASPMFI